MWTDVNEYSLPEDKFDAAKEYTALPDEYPALAAASVAQKKSSLTRVLMFSSALLVASGTILGAKTAVTEPVTATSTAMVIESPTPTPSPEISISEE